MVSLEKIAKAALEGEALLLRSLTQDWLRENPRLAGCARPSTTDPQVLAVAAALVEMFAERASQPSPGWTQHIGPLEQPFYLVHAAGTMKRLRRMCETESPAPLRRRNLFAPADYLRFA